MRILFLLLPALIPSWRFFKTVAPSPRLYARMEGDWHQVPAPDMPLTWGAVLLRLVWNPDWNAHLFAITLAERLIETGDARALEALRRYAADRLDWPLEAVRLRIALVSRQGDQTVTEDVYRDPA